MILSSMSVMFMHDFFNIKYKQIILKVVPQQFPNNVDLNVGTSMSKVRMVVYSRPAIVKLNHSSVFRDKLT